MSKPRGGTVLMTNLITTDVLFVADHFIMVTTVETMPSIDTDTAVLAAWERLADEYGVDWVNKTKSLIKRVSIEKVPGTSADEENK
jgi:hypothetical protein